MLPVVRPGAVPLVVVRPGAIPLVVVRHGAVPLVVVRHVAVPLVVVRPGAVPLVVVRPGAVPLVVVRPGAVPLVVVRPGAVPLVVVRPGAVPLVVVRPGAVPRVVVRPGAVPLVVVRPGAVPLVVVRHGAVPLVVVRPGAVPRVVVRPGAVPLVVVRHGAVPLVVVRPGAVPLVVVRPGAVPLVVVRHGAVPLVVVRHGAVPLVVVRPGAVPLVVVRPGAVPLVVVRHGVARGRHRFLGLPLRLHAADLAGGGHAQLHGTGGWRVVVDTHLEGVVRPAVVLPAVVVQEAGEDERHCERESADAEEDQPYELAHVKVEVEGDGPAVDYLDVVGDGADEDWLLRDKIADQHTDDAENQEVGADPHKHLPPDSGGGTAVAAGTVRGEQIASGVILVDVRVLVDMRLVEIVQVGFDAEVVGATSYVPRCRVRRLSLHLLVHLLHRHRPFEAFSLRRTAARFLLLACRTLLAASAGDIIGQFHEPAIAAAYVARLVGHRGGVRRLATGQE